MKFIIATILLFASVSVISAQRGSYAGNTPIVSGLRQPYESDLSNRQENNQPINTNAAQQPSQASQVPLQVPAFVSQNNNNNMLIDRVNQLPPSSQPFWFLNPQAINAHINQPQPGFGGPQNGFGGSPVGFGQSPFGFGGNQLFNGGFVPGRR